MADQTPLPAVHPNVWLRRWARALTPSRPRATLGTWPATRAPAPYDQPPVAVEQLEHGSAKQGDADSGDLAFLRAVTAAFPFAHYRQIEMIRAQADPSAPIRPDMAADPPAGREEPTGPRARLAQSPAAETVCEGVPLTRHLCHTAACAPPIDLTDPHAAARFALEHFRSCRDTAGAPPPIGPALAAALNADTRAPWEGAGRLTRLMAALGGDTAAAAGQEALADWWLEAAGHLPAVLTPDWLSQQMTAVPPGGEGRPFALGARLLRLHRRSATYPARYRLDEPADRVAFAFDLLLHLFDTPTRRLAFNSAALDWFRAPLDADPSAPSRFEALVALQAGMPPSAHGAWQDETLRHWFRSTACRVFPAFALFSTLNESQWCLLDRRLEVVGMARSSTGLGQNLAMSARALGDAGIAITQRDSEAGFEALAEPANPASGAERRGVVTPRRKAMLLHLNADRAPAALYHPLFDRHEDLHAIGYFLWELEALPAAHRLGLDLVDEVWCPTQFLARVYQRHTERPVHAMGKAISLPTPMIPDRRRLGLSNGDFVFLASFDFHSSVERKNPLAAVVAFQKAFGAPAKGPMPRAFGRCQRPAGPRLVIKTTPPVEGHWGDPNGQWPKILAAAEADPRVVIQSDHLPFAELIGLIAMADTLVSTHRAEGFGYLPAYALALGRPVLATGYGGTADFVTGETGYPIPWHPRPVAPGETILPVEDAFWADICTDALAAAMAALVDTPEEGHRRALKGKALMAREYSPQALAQRYRARLAAAGVV